MQQRSISSLHAKPSNYSLFGLNIPKAVSGVAPLQDEKFLLYLDNNGNMVKIKIDKNFDIENPFKVNEIITDMNKDEQKKSNISFKNKKKKNKRKNHGTNSI